MLDSYKREDKIVVAVDCIIFGFDSGNLKILLIKRDFEPEKGKWSLIGGFLKKDESLDEAANRVLKVMTGLDDIYMEQFYAYGAINRDPADRTLSIAYYALINIEDNNEAIIEKYSAQWFSVEDKPKLIFDHDDMVEHGMRRLQYRTSTRPIGFELLPNKFTMRQLQNLYESIIGKKLDKRNFISKINTLDVLIKLNEKDMSDSRKGSFLYVFDEQKYLKKVKEEGFSFKL